LSRTRGWIIQRAQHENWAYCEFTVKSGKKRRYHIKDLPEDIQTAYAGSLNISLEELKARLYPGLKAEGSPRSCHKAPGKMY
jgi:hypothetical protein